jgi:hypothetical protein
MDDSEPQQLSLLVNPPIGPSWVGSAALEWSLDSLMEAEAKEAPIAMGSAAVIGPAPVRTWWASADQPGRKSTLDEGSVNSWKGLQQR